MTSDGGGADDLFGEIPEDWLDPDDLIDVDEQALEAARRQLAAGMFGPSRWFPPVDDAALDDPAFDRPAGEDAPPRRFVNGLNADGRRLVARVAAELRDLLLSEDESLRRLYPTAYPDDPARDAEFADFAHDQLLMARLEALDVVERTVESDELAATDLQCWMQVLNQARLVLGTRLDVSENDPRDGDPRHPDAAGFELYHLLGRLVGDIVDALHTEL
jgi:hypothetical protein